MEHGDGQGREAAKYNGMISGRLLSYYQMGALYGATSSDAYIINTGADVNTPNSIANRAFPLCATIPGFGRCAR